MQLHFCDSIIVALSPSRDILHSPYSATSDSLITVNPDHAFISRALLSLALILMVFAGLIVIVAAVSGVSYGPVLASLMMISLWAGVVIAIIAQIVAMATPGAWRLDVRAPWLVIAILATGITMPLFELFKQRILPLRGFPFDRPIAAFERTLLFGHDAWSVTHALFGTVGATLFFDRLYAVWLPMMFLFPIIIVVAARSERLRARLLMCWLSSWVFVAGIGAWIFGSAGPCYYTRLIGPDAGFAGLDAQLARLSAQAHANGQVIAAVDFQTMLLSEFGADHLLPAGGISAMPSMHVAMAVLFALAGFSFGRIIGWIFATYALLIWIGSIHLGWHYATDGIVGAVMMFGLWHLSGKWAARG